MPSPPAATGGHQPVRVALHSMTSQGRKALGEQWMSLFYTLRSRLQESGRELPASGEELLLFTYDAPGIALATLFEQLPRLKQEFHWENAAPLPIQIVVHLEQEEDALPLPLNVPDSHLWDLLAPETVYVSRPLHDQWPQLVGEHLPPHHLEEKDMGLFQLKLAQPLSVREPLFPYRHLPLAGQHKTCFYCGMASHQPAHCPSKLINLQTQGLPLVGYLPIPQLAEQFREAFNSQERMVNVLAAGVTGTQLRRDSVLQVFVAYLDLLKVYQPRFLWNMAFSIHNRWEDLGRPEPVTVDSHSLHLGMDCLRVGQYAQAEELFVDESRRPRGKQFYATIGRAFIALELERDHDMGHYLESAQRLTSTDRERIYVSLLLSRYYDLHDDSWKAAHALDNIFSVDRDCTDALYAQVLLSVKEGFTDKGLRQLRTLIVGQKELFMQTLMDPRFTPVQGPVEDILASRLQAQEQDAEEQLTKARAQCQELSGWLAEDEEELAPLLEDLAAIDEQYLRKSYYDMIDVAEKSRLLLHACYRLQEAKLDQLKEEIAKAMRRWEGFRYFWSTYRYQSLFKEFQNALSASREKLSQAQENGERNMHGSLYRTTHELLTGLEEEFETMKQLTTRMAWVRIVLDGLRLFGTRLVVTEIVLLVLAVLTGPALTLILADNQAAGLAELLRDPWFQKQVLYITTLFIAPLLALAQTFWKLTKT